MSLSDLVKPLPISVLEGSQEVLLSSFRVRFHFVCYTGNSVFFVCVMKMISSHPLPGQGVLSIFIFTGGSVSCFASTVN